jgi:putative endonuclease
VVPVRAKDALGRYGEELAARYLTEAGLEVVDRNWRCPAGDLDLIAREGAVLVVCEVKTRRSDAYGGPFSAITVPKLQRLRRLAVAWLEADDRPEPVRPREIRVDVIGVWAPFGGRPRVEHLRGVE